MIRNKFMKLNINPEETFRAIPDEIFDSVMEELDTKLNKKMHLNQIQENASI